MTKEDAYKAVIAMLSRESIDYRSIVFKVAQHDPLVIAEALGLRSLSFASQLDEAIYDLYAAEGIVSAIREYRRVTGAEIIDAKDYIFGLIREKSRLIDKEKERLADEILRDVGLI